MALPRARTTREVRRPSNLSISPPWVASLMIIVASLYFARELLIPFILSLLLSFVLAPVVIRLRRWGLGRIPAVAVTVAIAISLVGSVGTFFVVQLVDVTMRLPEYQGNIEKKIESLKVSPGGPVDRAIRMFTRLSGGADEQEDETKEGKSKEGETREGEAPPVSDAATDQSPKPVAFQMAEPTTTPFTMMRSVLGTTLGPLATTGIVLVLVIFMLIEREALRDRLIRAIGTAPGQINTTTEALDDAASRVSRYLFMQLIVNVTYGIPIGIGLYFIGVPNPVLWGMMATVLRFIPYIGPIIASTFPIALAFAVDPGWGMVIKTLLLFAVVEIISNNFIETWLYGSTMGISSVAILLSALFWAWLWGPIGLLLSTPMTVCLMVLGRHIPALHNLSVMLGDQPGLPLHERMYQRFLAMDPDEPDHIAQEYLEDHTVEELFGQVLLPTLRLLEDQRHEETIEPERRAFVLENMRELIEDVADHADPAPKDLAKHETDKTPAKGEKIDHVILPVSEITSASDMPKGQADESSGDAVSLVPPSLATASLVVPTTVVCIPAHDESDEIVALMITVLLRRRGIATSIISADQSAAERIEQLQAEKAPIAFISVLPPFADVYARHTVQRIHARLPEMKLIVGFWEASAVSENLNRQLTAAGATEVVSAIAQALKSILALVEAFPVQTRPEPDSQEQSRMALDRGMVTAV